jgi:hypothetical protein
MAEMKCRVEKAGRGSSRRIAHWMKVLGVGSGCMLNGFDSKLNSLERKTVGLGD